MHEVLGVKRTSDSLAARYEKDLSYSKKPLATKENLENEEKQQDRKKDNIKVNT